MSELIKFDIENKTKRFLIGTDEAGRGPAAGDVYAAAVCFVNPPCKLLAGLNDSKKISESKREEFYELIKQNSVYAVCKSTVAQIEKMNILNASLDAMRRACCKVISQLETQDIEVFVDGNKLIKNFQYAQKFIIKGDATSASIAAASILAKVERDRAMQKLHKKYPQYCWSDNKGYLSRAHIDAIKTYGINEYHRKLFVRKILEEQSVSQLALF